MVIVELERRSEARAHPSVGGALHLPPMVLDVGDPRPELIVSPHRPRKLSLTPLQDDILREVADPVEVDPAYVCILASARMPQRTPEEIVSASEAAVRALARAGLIGFCRWTPEHGEADEVVTVDGFCSALHEKVRWDPATGSWKSEDDAMELVLQLTPEGEARRHA